MTETKVVCRNTPNEINGLLVDGWNIKQISVVTYTQTIAEFMQEQKFRIYAVLERQI